MRWLRSLLLFALTICFTSVVNAQISPGPLAKAHQSLSGDSNCVKCHVVSAKTPSFRCLECHREIAAEIAQNRGLHSTYQRSATSGAACVKCHSDHNGTDFPMVHWDPTPKGFDHSKTGYMLDGKHMGVGCRTCHNVQHVSTLARMQLVGKDLNHTWLGLSKNCITCHEDRHQGRFGATCAQCHSAQDWKSAKVEKQTFDHSKTRFPLTGAHRNTICQSCHALGIDGQPHYFEIKFSNCSDCHTDPHKGEFKQGCDSCHNTSTWKKSSFATKFDHSSTAFPLMGKHIEVSCASCHMHGDFKAPIAHQSCADCHRPDPHRGQFAKRADGGRCESCHTVAGWSPSTFSVADHAKTGYPLVFPHAKVQCASCHRPAGNATRYKIKFAQCLDCHEDEHQGQFASAPWRNRCEQCHNGETFKTTNYTIVVHQKSKFQLTGGHVAVACVDCHKPVDGSRLVIYHFDQLSCATCHEDIHKGEFDKRMTAHDKAEKQLGCEACHSTKGWEDLAKFDHSNTHFPLEGSHRAVACSDCHMPPNMELNLRHVRFTSASSECRACHENPHGDQFGVTGSNCASCHNSNKWRPSLFDHEKTGFSLKGGHEDVACSACHTLKKLVDGNEVLFYKPTPTACADCHGMNIPRASIQSVPRK